MNLYWGVFPLANAPLDSRECLTAVAAAAKEARYLEYGDRVIYIVGSSPESQDQNVLYVHVVE